MIYKEDWLSTLENSLKRKSFSFAAEMEAKNFRKAAVLILFWDDGGQPASLVTVRASTMPTHPGEVSFPGGGLQEGEDSVHAALREAQEEVGLDPSSVRVLGRLDDAWSGAGFALVPVVAVSAGEPKLRTNHEVQRAVTMNLSTDLEYLERTVRKFGSDITEPFIRAHNTDIVGLTADIFAEALEALRGDYTGRGPRRHEYFVKYAKARS